MGWKIVRDNNEAWSRAHGVSGQWRLCELPEDSLLKKLFEEAGEYAESLEPDELYDLRDVVNELISRVDPERKAFFQHEVKVNEMGTFSQCVEWCPVPVEAV